MLFTILLLTQCLFAFLDKRCSVEDFTEQPALMHQSSPTPLKQGVSPTVL